MLRFTPLAPVRALAVVSALSLAACAGAATEEVANQTATGAVSSAPVDERIDKTAGLTVEVFGATPDPEAPRRRVSASTRCAADDWVELLGTPADAIPTDRLPEPFRIIPQGSMATQDFRPDRLNIFLDKDRIVARMTCG